jgi:hypothetical protein
MKNNIQTMKISELIKDLMVAMNQLGDIPVIHSRDEEGNSYNTIKSDSISYMDTDKAGRVLVLYPFEEYIDEQLFNND